MHKDLAFRWKTIYQKNLITVYKKFAFFGNKYNCTKYWLVIKVLKISTNFSLRTVANFHRERSIPPVDRSACQHERCRRNKEELRLRRRLPPAHILLLSSFFYIPLQPTSTSECCAVEWSQFWEPSGKTVVH